MLIFVLIFLWFIGFFTSKILITKKQLVNIALDIKDLYNQRLELIPIYIEFIKDNSTDFLCLSDIDPIIDINQILSIKINTLNLDIILEINNDLSYNLKLLMAICENCRSLKYNIKFNNLSENLRSIDNKIDFLKLDYNSYVKKYNKYLLPFQILTFNKLKKMILKTI